MNFGSYDKYYDQPQYNDQSQLNDILKETEDAVSQQD